MFRPQFLAIFRELINLCSLYVNILAPVFTIYIYMIKVIIKIELNIKILNISLHNVKSPQVYTALMFCVQTSVN
jgi:hypothetical protein